MIAIGRRHPTIRIDFDTPTVKMFGERAASAGSILTGSVILDFKTATKVREIEVSIFGTYTVNIPIQVMHARSTAQYIKYRKELINNTQTVVEGKNGPIHYPAGQHKHQFEFILPGDIPATAQLSSSGGRIGYSVCAQAVLTGLRSNCEAIVPVVIVRCPSEGSEWANTSFDSLFMEANWDDKLKVTLLRGSRAIPAGGSAEFTVSVEPSIKRVQVISFDLRLRETQSVFKGIDHELISKKSHVVAQTKVEFTENNGDGVLTGPTDYSITLNTPEAYNKLQFEHESGWATVKHTIILIALIRAPTGSVVEMELPSHVSVLPDVSLNDATELPLYEDSRVDQLIQSGPSSSRTPSRVNSRRVLGRMPTLPPYSPPICPECGIQDIRALECRRAVVQLRETSPNADIEDLCAGVQRSSIG